MRGTDRMDRRPAIDFRAAARVTENDRWYPDQCPQMLGWVIEASNEPMGLKRCFMSLQQHVMMKGKLRLDRGATGRGWGDVILGVVSWWGGPVPASAARYEQA
eukprot:632460-Hanusia_phi.AAC.1